MKLGDYETHPAADVWPLMVGDDYNELRDDIKANGQREPIVIWRRAPEDEVLIDGRNRLRACLELELEPLVRAFDGGEEEVLPFIWSANSARRNLNDSQRALVAARFAMLARGPRARQSVGSPATQKRAAAAANVKLGQVERATALLKKADPSVIEAVDAQELSLEAALGMSKMTHTEQRKTLQQLRSGEGIDGGAARDLTRRAAANDETADPAVLLLRAIQTAATRAGATIGKLDKTGLKLAFHGRVYRIALSLEQDLSEVA